MADIVTGGDHGFSFLAHRPARFGAFDASDNIKDIANSKVHYNSELPMIAFSASHFPWVVYGFNSGHFVSIIEQQNLPFTIVLACDPYSHGRALFHEIANCATVLSGAGEL